MLNPGKCHFMFIGKGSHDDDFFCYDNLALKDTNRNVKHNRKLTFHQLIKKMCHKAGQN